MTRIPLLAFAALALIACQATEPSSTSQEPAPAAESAASGEVSYEPAYPEDVSAEGLSEEDVAQQEVTHSHGGEEHSHADGDHGERGHSHGEGDGHDADDHSHGDGDSDPSH